MNIIEKIWVGLKRLFFGYTTYFKIYQNSCALNGVSFVSIFQKIFDYPVSIVAIEFLMEKDIKAYYRFLVNGEKIFPFGDKNEIENGVNRALITVNIAAGERFSIEVCGDNPTQKNVIILNELDVIEKR